MRTREYVEKGETEGKSLLDAMRDGSTEGMQYIDGELERMIRAGILDLEVGLSYATNVGNLRLELADLAEAGSAGLHAFKPQGERCDPRRWTARRIVVHVIPARWLH